MNQEQILEAFREKVLAGDAEGAQSFLTQNLGSLSEDLQGKILFELMKQEGDKDSTQLLAMDVQGAAAQLLDVIDEAEKQLEMMEEPPMAPAGTDPDLTN